jgi:hypothetical protein
MKGLLASIVFSGISLFSMAQSNGLEGIIVEKYYISSKQDSEAPNLTGKLAPGSVTYRVFVDLLPGHRFSMAYGSSTHPLFFKTNTYFYNHLENGSTVASTVIKRKLSKNTLMLDSWLSVGTAAEGSLGILKSDDDTLENTPRPNQFLINADKKAGEPLTVKDGLKASEYMPNHTFFGIDTAVQVFNQNSEDNLFYTENGAWACMGLGAVGPDSLSTNRVLIAQVTTDGLFEFELNILTVGPDRKTQRFVARNPEGEEILLESLIYTSSKKSKNKNK